MLIVDTGPLVAYLNRNDPDHDRCAALLTSASHAWRRSLPLAVTDCGAQNWLSGARPLGQPTAPTLGRADVSVFVLIFGLVVPPRLTW